MKERHRERTSELLPATWRLIAETEALAGRRIEVRASPGIRERGRALFLASGPDPSRALILYDPLYSRYLDHLVAHECGHIQRFLSVPADQRIVPVASRERRLLAVNQLGPELIQLAEAGLPPEAIGEVMPTWHSGTVAQLADTPADIRIERWLWSSWSELRQAQAASLRDQARTLQLVLHPSVELLTPPTIFRSSNAMNFALLRAIADLLKDEKLVAPYAGTPAARLGSELLEMLDAEPDTGFAGDRLMTDRWARHLGLSLWLDWCRLDDLPKGYRHAWE